MSRMLWYCKLSAAQVFDLLRLAHRLPPDCDLIGSHSDHVVFFFRFCSHTDHLPPNPCEWLIHIQAGSGGRVPPRPELWREGRVAHCTIESCDAFHLVRLAGLLPPGAVPSDDPETTTPLTIRIAAPSFPVVPQGGEIPRWDAMGQRWAKATVTADKGPSPLEVCYDAFIEHANRAKLLAANALAAAAPGTLPRTIVCLPSQKSAAEKLIEKWSTVPDTIPDDDPMTAIEPGQPRHAIPADGSFDRDVARAAVAWLAQHGIRTIDSVQL